MEFQSPHYRHFVKEFHQIARQFSLDPNNLTIEFYSPQSQAIITEQIGDTLFKVHINLEEERIISVQRVPGSGNGVAEALKEKYRKFMR